MIGEGLDKVSISNNSITSILVIISSKMHNFDQYNIKLSIHKKIILTVSNIIFSGDAKG